MSHVFIPFKKIDKAYSLHGEKITCELLEK